MVAGLEPARDIRAHRAFPPRCMFGLSIYQLIYTIISAGRALLLRAASLELPHTRAPHFCRQGRIANLPA